MERISFELSQYIQSQSKTSRILTDGWRELNKQHERLALYDQLVPCGGIIFDVTPSFAKDYAFNPDVFTTFAARCDLRTKIVIKNGFIVPRGDIIGDEENPSRMKRIDPSSCVSVDMDLQSGKATVMLDSGKIERECRSSNSNPHSDAVIIRQLNTHLAKGIGTILFEEKKSMVEESSVLDVKYGALGFACITSLVLAGKGLTEMEFSRLLPGIATTIIFGLTTVMSWGSDAYSSYDRTSSPYFGNTGEKFDTLRHLNDLIAGGEYLFAQRERLVTHNSKKKV